MSVNRTTDNRWTVRYYAEGRGSRRQPTLCGG